MEYIIYWGNGHVCLLYGEKRARLFITWRKYYKVLKHSAERKTDL